MNSGAPPVKILGRDDFRHLRRVRHLVYWLLCLQNRFLLSILSLIPDCDIQVPRARKSGDRSVLFLSRDFGASNASHLEILRRNVARHLSLEPIKSRNFARTGNTLFGNARWTREIVSKETPHQLVLLDPQLLGLPGPLGVLSIWRLHRICKRAGIRVVLVAYDLHDPQATLFSVVLRKFGYQTLFVCSSGEEARKWIGCEDALGPAPEISMETIRGGNRSFRERSIAVHLPRPSYEPRRSLVLSASEWLSELDISFTVGGSFPRPEDLWDSLHDTKIVVVTNSIAVGGIGGWPLPAGPEAHLVSYNAEALAAGALLVSQECEAINSILDPGKHYLPFKSADDLREVLLRALGDSSSADIAKAGHERLRTLWQIQPSINSLLLRK